ncbi:MAG: hypothetical protein HY668_00235 [Chloroflexi bacterium]|nr:hypothetical protein [Chloroflexota bacterium]
MATGNVQDPAVGPRLPAKTPGGAGNAGAGKRRRFSWFQWLLVIGLLFLVWYGFGRNVLAPAKPLTAPQYVGSLKLVRQVGGAEALSEIDRLHGTSIGLTTALIADYGGGSERLMVWVGGTGSHDAATDLMNRMVNGIRKGGTGFTGLRRTGVSGLDIWQVDGPDGSSFFYISPGREDSVVWLTIQGSDVAALLESAIKAF